MTPVRAPPPGRAGYGCSHRPLVGRVRPTRPGPSPYPYPVARALSLLTTVCARVIPPGLAPFISPGVLWRGKGEGECVGLGGWIGKEGGGGGASIKLIRDGDTEKLVVRRTS